MEPNHRFAELEFSLCTYRKGMFLYCQNFEGLGLDNWLVSNVEDFSYMFAYAEQFDAPIGNWDTASATNVSLS